jgi:hypothetical protein
MIVEILRHTPVWVFLILAALVYLGARRVRTSQIPARQLFVMPVAMAGLSLFGLYQAFGASPVAAATWILLFALLLATGWILPTNPGVQYSSATRRIHVPGSWLPLALMLTIFFLRYVIAVSLAMHPSLRIETPFVAGIGAVYGLSAGCFAARALMTLRGAFGRGTTGRRFPFPA